MVSGGFGHGSSQPICIDPGKRWGVPACLSDSQMGKLRLGYHTAYPGPSQAAGLGSGLTLVAQSVAPTAFGEQDIDISPGKLVFLPVQRFS